MNRNLNARIEVLEAQVAKGRTLFVWRDTGETETAAIARAHAERPRHGDAPVLVLSWLDGPQQ